ncbi:MAG TPA: hypothetical protein VGC42_13000 [Kofleriaceae bacterium]
MTRLAAAASLILLGVACGVAFGIGLGVVFSSVASAAPLDDGGPVLRDAAALDVAVGDTVTRDVGFALGLACDDLSAIRADLHTAASGTNVFEVTGVKLGDTVCRAGTTPNRPSFVFRVHVVPARRAQ